MSRLIKMDFTRLFLSKIFWVCLMILTLIEGVIAYISPLLVNWMGPMTVPEGETYVKQISEITLTELISSPISTLFILPLFISIVSFFYADLANGYIKNIAGQIPKKGYTAISKFIVCIFHNLIFLAGAFVGRVLGTLVCPDARLSVGSDIFDSIIMFFIKYSLLLATCAIILFVVTALQSKTLGSVLGVMFSVGALSTIYMLLDSIINNLIKDFKVEEYSPSTLMTANLTEFGDSIRAIIVAAAFIVGFLFLSVKVFNRRDVK